MPRSLFGTACPARRLALLPWPCRRLLLRLPTPASRHLLCCFQTLDNIKEMEDWQLPKGLVGRLATKRQYLNKRGLALPEELPDDAQSGDNRLPRDVETKWRSELVGVIKPFLFPKSPA